MKIVKISRLLLLPTCLLLPNPLIAFPLNVPPASEPILPQTVPSHCRMSVPALFRSLKQLFYCALPRSLDLNRRIRAGSRRRNFIFFFFFWRVDCFCSGFFSHSWYLHVLHLLICIRKKKKYDSPVLWHRSSESSSLSKHFMSDFRSI